MRSSKSRSRSKSNRQRSLGNIVNRVFDSSVPEGKVRGTPQQIIEKYLTLARDAQLSGDRVAEQSFLQHAEHYTRMLGEAQREMAERQAQGHSQGRQSDDDNGYSNHGYGHNARRDGGRDQQPRDQQLREQQPRDQQQSRDQQPREQQPREQQGRDQRSPRENRPEPAEVPQPDDAPSLPEVVQAGDENAAEPVSTPEAEAKPTRSRTSRPRTPRAPAAEKPAGETAERKPRSRRKPAADAAPSDGAAEERHVDSTAQSGGDQD